MSMQSTLVSAGPIRKLLDELQRRRDEQEEQTDEKPVATLEWLSDRLADALKAAAALDRWVPTEVAADLAGVSEATIRRWCREGRVSATRTVAGCWRVDRTAVLERRGGPVLLETRRAA